MGLKVQESDMPVSCISFAIMRKKMCKNLILVIIEKQLKSVKNFVGPIKTSTPLIMHLGIVFILCEIPC